MHINFITALLADHVFLWQLMFHSKWPKVCIMNNTTNKGTIHRLRKCFSALVTRKQSYLSRDHSLHQQSSRLLLKRYVHIITTAPYHPRLNHLADRSVQSLTTAIKNESNMGNLVANLHNFLLACRNTSHATTKEAPPILMFGHRLHSKLDILKPAEEELVLL